MIRALCLAASLALVLSGLLQAASDTGWLYAAAGRAIVLPADHVSHPDYRLEWWYYTGNLDASDGRRFGYQLTFFRVGIDPQPVNPSAWTVRDLYMAHFTVTDASRGTFHAAELLSRKGIGWAGARTDTYSVWNDGWSVRLDRGVHRLEAADRTTGTRLSLSVEEGKEATLNGDGGFSQKGQETGNASYYYSLTRMPTHGTITVAGQEVHVRGSSWMDHEFGTSLLERGQTGWDWFSLQLDDGSDVMLYRLRRTDGSMDPHSSGTASDTAGRSHRIDLERATFTPRRTWRSPATSATYPVEWRVSVPSAALELTVRAIVDGQELAGLPSGVAYWEGAIDVEGTRAGRTVRGRGYLEMTGYAGRSLSGVLNGRQ
jgi:predicted secreted hydrolase